MIKTILTPLSGDGTDDRLLAAALAVGRPLMAHIDFYHVRSTPCEAAVQTRHLEFCVDSQINEALGHLAQQDEEISGALSRKVVDFRRRNDIPDRWDANAGAGMSATLLQATDHAEARLCFRALHSDMVLIGRPGNGDSMPYRLIETLLLRGGRPIMIAAETSPTRVTDTIVIGWKETPEAARAVACALPLLKLAGKVVLVHIAQDDDSSLEGLRELNVNLARHGIAAETRLLVDKSNSETALQRTALDEGATLLVVGGYGHRPVREALFGGLTRALIEHAELPVLLMH